MLQIKHLLALLSAVFASEVVTGPTVILPPSSDGVLRLLMCGARPVARSYDALPWELVAAPVGDEALSCSGGECVMTLNGGGRRRRRLYFYADFDDSLPGDAGGEEECDYKYEEHNRPGSVDDRGATARFLTQASFGPTRALLDAVDGATASGAKAWVEAQLALPASEHRVYYRRRANLRLSTPRATGGVRSACFEGSRWHRYALNRDDEGSQLEAPRLAGIKAVVS